MWDAMHIYVCALFSNAHTTHKEVFANGYVSGKNTVFITLTDSYKTYIKDTHR